LSSNASISPIGRQSSTAAQTASRVSAQELTSASAESRSARLPGPTRSPAPRDQS
jgi:hypothetical protein